MDKQIKFSATSVKSLLDRGVTELEYSGVATVAFNLLDSVHREIRECV